MIVSLSSNVESFVAMTFFLVWLFWLSFLGGHRPSVPLRESDFAAGTMRPAMSWDLPDNVERGCFVIFYIASELVRWVPTYIDTLYGSTRSRSITFVGLLSDGKWE